MKWIFLLTVVVQVNLCLGQNLVTNGTFEDVNICAERNQPCSPSGWFYIKKDGIAGYYSTPYGWNGKRYLTLMTANSYNTSRWYWQTMLLCPLVPGEKYTIRMQVAANVVGPNLNDIGLFFTDSLLYARKDTLLQPAAYFSFLGGKVKDLQNFKFQLEKEFTATEAHQYLIVGNFSRESNKHIYRKRGVKNDEMRMFIDNLEIIPGEKQICQGAQRIKDSLYAIHERHSVGGKSVLVDSLKLLLASADDDTAKTALPAADTGAVKQVGTGVKQVGTGVKQVDTGAREADGVREVDTVTINNVQFEFNSYTLKDPAVLDSMRGVFMRKDITRIRVVGFTDDVGSDAYNLSLSEKRAGEIRRLIGERFGISLPVISAEGKGISTSYADKSQNRRVDIYIYH